MLISDWSSTCALPISFGNLRVKVCSQLTAAYRSVPRPSSPVHAKASTKCPYLTLENPHHQQQHCQRLSANRAASRHACMSRHPATRTMPCRMMIVKNLSYLLQHDPGKEIAPPRHRVKTHSQCQRGPEVRQPDTPAAFRKAKPSRNLFPHSGTAFITNYVAAIPAHIGRAPVRT